MSYRDYCGLCGESYDDENLETCGKCYRSFCYHCGSFGEKRCRQCSEADQMAAEPPSRREGDAVNERGSSSRAMDTRPSSPPVAQHTFVCASCNNEAGWIALYEYDNGGEITRDSFTSPLTLPVGAEDFERTRSAILAGNIRALHEFDLEIASFYCPDCGACYCSDHWVRWNVFDDEEGFNWHDSIRGRCPRGHQRMLED